MTLRFYWQVWSILSTVRIFLLGRKLIFDDLFFMYKPHYCFMREACQFACFEQNTSAEMYPLHYILCSITGGRGYVGKDRRGLCPQCRAASVTSLPAWNQADRQQLCTPGAIPPARHSHLPQTCSIGTVISQVWGWPRMGILREPRSCQGSATITTTSTELCIVPGKWEKVLVCSLDWLMDDLPARV